MKLFAINWAHVDCRCDYGRILLRESLARASEPQTAVGSLQNRISSNDNLR